MYASVPIAIPGFVSGFCPAPSVCICEDVSGLGASRAFFDFRQSEIEQFRVTALRHKNIRGLDVAVHDALAVRSLQAIGNLDRQLQQLRGAHRLSVNAVAQRLPFENFHHQKRLAFVIVDVVKRADARVIQRGSSTRFALKAFQCRTIASEFRREKLQSNGAPQPNILGSVNDAHPASAKFFDDAVMRNGNADQRRRVGQGAAILCSRPKPVNDRAQRLSSCH